MVGAPERKYSESRTDTEYSFNSVDSELEEIKVKNEKNSCPNFGSVDPQFAKKSQLPVKRTVSFAKFNTPEKKKKA